MGWISFIYAVVSVASILFLKVASIRPVSFRSSRVSVTSVHTLFIKVLQGFQLHPSILFFIQELESLCFNQELEGFRCIYIHPSSFHQRSAGFSVASMHPLFIQKLVGFPLHPSILFSSNNSTVSVCILPLFHPRVGGFSTSSIHPPLHLRARGFPTSLIHPLFSSTSPRVFHFTHPSSCSSKSNIWHPKSKSTWAGGHYRIRRHL